MWQRCLGQCIVFLFLAPLFSELPVSMAFEKGVGLTLGKMSEESKDGLTAGGDWIPALDFRGHGKIIGFSSQVSFQSAGDTDFYGENYGDLQYKVGGFFRLGAALAKSKIYPHIKTGFVIFSFRQWQLETLADLDLEHSISPAYGAGFDCWLSDRLGFAIDYTIMELDYGKISQKHDLVSLGLFWRIGRL